MTYFKLNIPKTNELISRFKEIKKNCYEDINLVYRGLGYIESGWNDPKSLNFKDAIKNDKYKIEEYFTNLENLYNEINRFNDNIDNLCIKQGYKKNSVYFKFDDSDIRNCIQNLNYSVDLLDESLNMININSFGSNFKYINTLYTLRSEIKSIRSSIKEMINDINSLVKTVSNEVEDSRVRIKRLGDINLNLKPLDFKWKVVDAIISSNSSLVNNYGTSAKNIDIDNNINVSKVISSGISESIPTSSFNMDKFTDNEKLTNNLGVAYSNNHNVNFNANDISTKVSGISNFTAEEKNVDFNNDNYNNNLNNNQQVFVNRDNKVEFNISNNNNLNNSKDSVKVNSNIDFDNIIDDNISINSRAFKVQNNKIDFSVNNTNYLNSSKESVKANSNIAFDNIITDSNVSITNDKTVTAQDNKIDFVNTNNE